MKRRQSASRRMQAQGATGIGLWAVGLCALLGSLVWCTPGVAAPASVVASSEDRQNADRLMVVDCLLPAQVHQLGTSMTYLAPRRAIKTTGSTCAIRGGEYVAYDRANYASALKVWLPAAQGGDKVAQTYVGEIYEKGLGTAPDYASAASWYQKAADQGYSRALINLGFLYEKGLGVPKDQAMALKLYRKAAGIEGSISLEGRPVSASKQELDEMRKELERTRQELERARRLLDEERLKSSQEIERLTQQKLQGCGGRQCRGVASARIASEGARNRAGDSDGSRSRSSNRPTRTTRLGWTVWRAKAHRCDKTFEQARRQLAAKPARGRRQEERRRRGRAEVRCDAAGDRAAERRDDPRSIRRASRRSKPNSQRPQGGVRAAETGSRPTRDRRRQLQGDGGQARGRSGTGDRRSWRSRRRRFRSSIHRL